MKKINTIWLLLLYVLSTGIGFAQQKEIPRDTTYNVPRVWRQTIKNYPEAKIASTAVPKGVIAAMDVIYLTLPETPFGKRDLHADIFRPKKKGTYPTLIMVHGGGWRSGDKSMQWAMATRLAERGYVTICVEYQLSLEAKYPAALHNIKAAIRWARANAAEYQIDTNHIAISGCSAGGQLAALTGLTSGVAEKEGAMGYAEFSSEIQAIIDIDGVIDFMAPWSLNLNRKPDSPDIEWMGGSFSEKPEIWKDASPIFWANEKSPPVMFLKSGYSRFSAGSYELAGMLTEWGVYTETHRFEVQVHPFWLLDPWVEPTVNYMDAFLKKVFAAK